MYDGRKPRRVSHHRKRSREKTQRIGTATNKSNIVIIKVHGSPSIGIATFPGHWPNSPNKRIGRLNRQSICLRSDSECKVFRWRMTYAKRNGGGRAMNNGRQGSCADAQARNCHPNSRVAATGLTRKPVTSARQQASSPGILRERPVKQSKPKATSARISMIRLTVWLLLFITSLS